MPLFSFADEKNCPLHGSQAKAQQYQNSRNVEPNKNFTSRGDKPIDSYTAVMQSPQKDGDSSPYITKEKPSGRESEKRKKRKSVFTTLKEWDEEFKKKYW